jgi:hypothetical protein
MREISEDKSVSAPISFGNLADRPLVGDDRFWREAEAGLKFLQARAEINKRDHRRSVAAQSGTDAWTSP